MNKYLVAILACAIISGTSTAIVMTAYKPSVAVESATTQNITPTNTTAGDYQTFISEMQTVNQSVVTGEDFIHDFKYKNRIDITSTSEWQKEIALAAASFISAKKEADKIQWYPANFANAVSYQNQMIDKMIQASTEYQQWLDDTINHDNSSAVKDTEFADNLYSQATDLQDKLNSELTGLIAQQGK